MTTRRQFLTALAGVAGAAGAYQVARAMGWAEGEAAWQGPPALAAGSGKGCRVAVLGAGPAGLAAAYELSLAGYEVTVLEAQGKVGGRVLTVRRGDRLRMLDGTDQLCRFDEGQYLNAGAARIPSHHQATLGYCRELGVPMETLVNHSDSALIQADAVNGGRPIQMRQALFDTRGHIAELLSKAVRGGGLDQSMSKADRDQLIAAMTGWGVLTPKGRTGAPRGPGPRAPDTVVGEVAYNGSSASGFKVPPGAGAQHAVARDPLPLKDLMHPIVGVGAGFHEYIDMQATMLQPVGGMDAIPMALARQLGARVKLNCPVTRVARKGAGVEVSYTDGGRPAALSADFCIVTLPLSVLSGVANDFSADRKAAIAKAEYGSAIKVAFQGPRFWEHRDGVYGGLSFTDRDTFITWYPSGGFHAAKGVLVAGYSFGGQADRFASLPLEQRFAYARATVDRLHPGQSAALEAPITVTWRAMPFARGIECPLGEEDPAAYTLLSEADGPFYFAGEHLSHVGAWQQGAFLSAQRTVALLDARRRGGQPVTAIRPQ